MPQQHTVIHSRRLSVAMVLGLSLIWILTIGFFEVARAQPALSEEKVAMRAKASWESGDFTHALGILDEWAEDHASSTALTKLRGDILAASRRLHEALEAYETVLTTDPTALDVRWSKWSVLVRAGQETETIAELHRMAQVDTGNPLIHLRLAQELRKLDRLEESLEWYKKAVELTPNLLSWRLGLARARFDVLDYAGAEKEVQYVLQRVPVGSPLVIPANNLLAEIHGNSRDRGRRFERVYTPPEVSEEHLKEWALIRGDAWRLFSAGRYEEAEPMYRRLLELNPKDPTAVHQFGLILMNLGRCHEAVDIFRKMSTLDAGDEEYADTVFRMGQCLVEMKRWEDAYVHFKVLYDAAVEFEEANRHVQLPPGTRVLNKEKLTQWLEKVRIHVPEMSDMRSEGAETERVLSEEELAAMIAGVRLTHKPLDTRASLMGRDADFSWFRFVIPSSGVMRDDFPTGAHEFIPLNVGDSFPTTQPEIYLVFGLVSASYDAVPLAARCFIETDEPAAEQRPLAQDRVVMSMSDQSGYFKLSRPATGWVPGLYRCGLFAGERTSADTHVDEVRFRILDAGRPS